jgi:hypothetical protein
MKHRFPSLLLLLQASLLSAIAQEAKQTSPSPTPSKVEQQGPQVSPTGTRQPSPEMEKLFSTFLGTWSVTEKYEPSETLPNGGVGEGEEVYHAASGDSFIIEEVQLKEPTGEMSGLGVAWWDEITQAYRALWCDNINPDRCVTMTHFAKWESDQFVLRGEFERNGKKFMFKEVFSDITPTSFTQTLYQGEAGKELKRLVTIQATRSGKRP